jgi:hypothetical protein
LIVLGVLAGLSLIDSLPPEPPEAPLLRWLRVCAEHPVRSCIAALLVALGLRRSGATS